MSGKSPSALRWGWIAASGFLFPGGTGLWVCLNSPIEQFSARSPGGRYRAVATTRFWQSLAPSMPGQGSDKACEVEIFDIRKGESMGRVPVSMLQNAAVRWSPHGAEVALEAEWDFASGTCWYWNRSQTRRIYTKR